MLYVTTTLVRFVWSFDKWIITATYKDSNDEFYNIDVSLCLILYEMIFLAGEWKFMRFHPEPS